jgi:hypothetical protein
MVERYIISIATCKLLGTALASLAFYLYSPLSHHSVLLPFLYIAILIYDVIYIGMAYMQQRAEPMTVPKSDNAYAVQIAHLACRNKRLKHGR